MIRKRLFDHNPELNTTSWWYWDDSNDDVWIEEVQNDEGQLHEFAKESRKDDVGRFNDGLHLVGSIPMPLYMKLKARHVFDDHTAFVRWWNSDEALPYKTREMDFRRKPLSTSASAVGA